MSYTITILGCGNSEGTPAIGNHWGECDPSEPKNRRMRPCVAVQSDTSTLIIDTGPDFKEQVNRNNISQIDGVLYTHAHADHVSGIDELRVWAKHTKQPVNVYGQEPTLDELKARFDYQFEQKHPTYPAVLTANTITGSALGKPMRIGDIDFIPFEQDHGTCTSLGFRFGDVAYSTDLIDLSDDALEALKGIKTWIVDGAGYNSETNPVHLSLERVYEFNQIIKAQNVYFTHLSRWMDYKTVLEETPEGYEPAYDGLVLKVSNS